ncbi:TldD/PmbA family protein [Brachyspira hampsonii]|uniref:Peptidase n=1 Tax=Brachyspira hampsonii 30446 TaxID=1289135 RepID=A0A2U4EU26_9SPIR|nr:TldD/PmbA family protein [Brachyspira hampsonii]EKV56068.1 peptidase [Brachyspira hampsonii 30446]MBW5389877.1 TldD/PmbA family protein [Brachyspira hampsonii]MBW5394287.1 TldD/PmbA family protein [Brachyspira hampsonii]OEJ20024.1 peptidase [Brachyspira hampsonii]
MADLNSFVNRGKEIYNSIKSKAKDIDEIEVYISQNGEESFGVRERDLDKYTFAETGGIGLRLIKNGKVGISFTEKIDSDINSSNIENLVNNAKTSLSYAASEPEYNVLIEKDEEKYYDMMNNDIVNLSNDELKKISLSIEDKLYSLDKRIVNVPSAGLERYDFIKCIINSNGICKAEKKNSIAYYGEVIAKDSNATKTFFDVYYSKDALFDADTFAKNIVDNVVNKLSARTIESGKYKTVFTSKAMITIIGSYLGLFSSEAIQKKLSLLEGKLDKKIASDIINIKDIPLYERGLANTNFDGEGSKTKDLNIITNGVLNSYLYNNYTAKKDGVKTTSHASRGFKTSIGISCHNFILENSNNSQEDLIAQIQNGVLVNSLTGTHAGVNAISGDFSLQAEGIKIENGKLSYTASPFIVSGNILELLSNVEMLANDTDYHHSSIYAPSALIRELSFAS